MSDPITIVGVGALGSHLAQALRNVAPLRTIDMDRVEMKNTLSQFHNKSAVGKNKAQALAQTMQFLWGIKIHPVPHQLQETNFKELLSGSCVIADCVDNAPTRKLIQTAATDLGIPCLHGALAADGGFGRIGWDSGFGIDEDAVVGAATCHGGEHLPFVFLVVSVMAVAVNTFLLRGQKFSYHVLPNGSTVKL